ncbi:hypothetical protein Dimus_006774 [Dionaea muscipula]
MLEAAAIPGLYSYPHRPPSAPSPSSSPYNPSPFLGWKRVLKPSTRVETIRWKRLRALAASTSDAARSSSPALSGSFDRTLGEQVPRRESSGDKRQTKNRVFFVDVNPIYYKSGTPNLRSFADWISLFFSQVSLSNPVIAVIDGEGGSEHRKQLLSSYKAHRTKYSPASQRYPRLPVEKTHRSVIDFLRKCKVPVVKVGGQEADDVIATLVDQVLDRLGFKVVIASPDKDFKQLISEDVQLAIPMPDLGRWSIYTTRHYLAQYECDPRSDLSLRCIIGDEADGVPGIQTLAPAFGRNTALKLLKKHGSLENLLNAAAVRTVAKQYAQDALIKHADHLRKNYEVLALRRDVDVHLRDEWLSERDTSYDSTAISNLYKLLGKHQNPNDTRTY